MQTTINSCLTLIDYLAFFSIISITILAALYKKKATVTKHNITEYLLMGRRLTLPMFIATLVASWYGDIFGVTQLSFEHGIYNLFTQGIFWYLSYIIFALFLVKKIRSHHVATLPELISKQFGKKSANFSAIIVFLHALPITYAIGIGNFLQLLFPVSLNIAIVVGVMLVAMYSYRHGLQAIVFSDAAQCLAMLFSIIAVVIYSYYNFGGYSFLTANLPATHLQPAANHSLPTFISWLFIGMATTFINPCFYQRCFAAKSTTTATVGILCATILWFIIDLCTTLGGMYAKAVMPECEPLSAYLVYSMNILPCGLRGVMLAGIASTILSTLDSFLFICSNILLYDLKIFLKSKLSIQQQQLLSMLIASILTIAIANIAPTNFEDIWYLTHSYFTAALLLPILLSILIPRFLTDSNFIITSIIAIICVTFAQYCTIATNYNINTFYIGNGATLVSILLIKSYQQFKSNKRVRLSS